MIINTKFRKKKSRKLELKHFIRLMKSLNSIYVIIFILCRFLGKLDIPGRSLPVKQIYRVCLFLFNNTACPGKRCVIW